MLALATMAALLAAGLVVPASRGGLVAADGTTPDEDTFTFRWAAPTDATGTFAATVIVDPDGEAECMEKVRATGTFNASNPVAFWQFGTTGAFAGHWRHAAQVHVGPADTRLLTAPDEGTWRKVQGFSKGTVEDGRTITITVAAFDLEHRSDSDLENPLIIDVSCDTPIDVELQAGRHARTFTPETLEGGVGASHNLLGGRIVARADRLVETFHTPIVRFQAIQLVGLTSDREGTMVLDHPAGTETWTWNPAGPGRIDLVGGPGQYEVTLDWRSTWNDALFGAIMGLEPVESLDEVLR